MDKKIIKIGIIGGLGPLASASFTETLYTTYLSENILKERYHPPYVYLCSEPLERSSTGLMSITQNKNELLGKLKDNIVYLNHQRVTCIIICCFTAHALLPELSAFHQNKIFPLITNVLEHILKHNNQFIILCATSAKEAQVLEHHPLWIKTSNRINCLDNESQIQLNALINRVKNNTVDLQVLNQFAALIHKFRDYKLIIACAELHVLYKRLQDHIQKKLPQIFDPFYHCSHQIWN